MKRKISISILLFCFVGVIGFFAWNFVSGEKEEQPSTENRMETETEENIVVSSTTEEPYKYIILEDAGRLSVYLSDNVTLFMNTGISVRALTEPLQKELKEGLRFQTETELYDFLESYSS